MSSEVLADFTCPRSADRCAWYLRVSTPRQKLEHQREHVLRFCERRAIEIPDDLRFEDQEKRHRSAKRQDFQRLLSGVRAGQLDWIIICSFDRWGVADVDEFFEFRRLLLKHDVQLWSVIDQMNLTGITEGDYFRIVAMAIGATKYVEQMAEKNILKMIEMAKQGWAATGNAPYGTDLVCYPLQDLSRPLFRVVRLRYMRPHLYRIVRYSPDSRVERDQAGIIVNHRLTVAGEEVSERMPLRDKKTTGYRLEPSIETDRIGAVNLIFELYESGMEFREIGRSLWGQGLKHYDKPFAYHAVETILANPAYLGLPAWGKLGVGAYRILHGGGPAKIRRRASDTLTVRKDESQYVQPIKPVFAPIVPAGLWQRVHDRLKDREHTNPDYGKRRTRDKATHPLNGKLVCPDCGEPMVLGSSMPAHGKRGKKTRCFNCGTYRRTSRLECHANTVGWDRLDQAIEALLDTVKDRIDRFVLDPVKALRDENWAKESELTKVLWSIGEDLQWGTPVELAEHAPPPPNPDVPILDLVFDMYNRMHAIRTQELRREVESIDKELTRIGDLLLEGIPSQTIKRQFHERMRKLEARKREIEPLLVPLTARADTLIQQLRALRQTIETSERVATARLLDGFIEKAIPHFDVQHVGREGRRRAVLRAVEFVPRQTGAARNVLPEAMEVGAARTGTGSSTPPG
jgi:DNA invertase Pin-like site-specific DNA recombinase